MQPAKQSGDDMVIIAQVTIDDDGNLPDGASTETFTQAAGWLASRRDRMQLFRRA